MTETTVVEKSPDNVPGGVAHTAENTGDQVLRAIEAVEEHLRDKRSRIEEIQRRRDRLAKEIEQLNTSLESEHLDFVPNLSAVISDLETDGEIVDLLPDMAVAAEAVDTGTNGAGHAQQRVQSREERPAKRGSLRWLKEKERSRWED